MGRPKKENNYDKVITVRISQGQYDFLSEISNLLSVSVNDYIRMVINSQKINYERKEVEYENEKGSVYD